MLLPGFREAVCAVCQGEFTTDHPNKLYCGEECARAMAWSRQYADGTAEAAWEWLLDRKLRATGIRQKKERWSDINPLVSVFPTCCCPSCRIRKWSYNTICRCGYSGEGLAA